MAESTILVNAEWKNESTGNTVTYNGKTYTIGSDAFGSIQTAVDAAQAGAIINVAKGEYAEDVTISKALTLNGASGYASKVTSIGIGADHVTIQGFSIKPAKQNCLGSNEMPLAAGVYLTAGGAGNPLQDITVTNNRIDCSGTMEAGVKATGVAFGTGPDSHFSTNVVVSNNRITGGNSDTAQNGIYLRFVDGATVAGNTVSDFSHHLVQFETGGNYTVSNNVLSNTDRNGIQFGGDTPGTNTVTGNSISNCRGSSSDDAALVLRNAGDGSLSVSGNNITDSTTGVYISNVTEVTGLMVSGNVIDSNTTDIVSDNASKVTLSGNNYGSEAATTKGNVDAGTSVDAETGEEKFIINAAFSSQKTVAGLDGKFYTVGTNAFATLPDAIAALSAQTEELEVTGTVNWPGNQTLDLSGTTGKIILTFNGLTGPTLGAYKNYIIGNDSTVVVFDNVDADCHIFLQNLEEVILTGNSSVRITTYNNNDNQSTTTFTEVGKLTVESGSVCDFANANQFGLRGTTIAGGGTIRTSGTLLISGDTSGFTGTLEITNGVQMESVASDFANASQIINNGTMYCNAAGTFTYANTITGDGMIKAWVQNAGTDVVLTGDLSGYTGQFDALSGNTIKLNTKLHDTINLAHSSGAAGMIELNGDGNSKDIIINSTTNTSTALKIFANWNNITVQSNGNETSTVLGTIYFGGNGNAAAAEDLKVALSSINQTDGKSIGNLYFGGIGNTVSDGADADTNAIYVVVDTNYGAIVGGGQQSTINGDITFDVVTGAFGAQIVGAGDGNTIDGNISINVSSADDASVGNIIGGQAVHEVSGNISIAIADGTVGNVYGLNSGDANGTAVGNIQIDVTGGTVSSIRGGNSTSGKVPGTFEAKSVKINLTGGEVTGKIYGGSQLTTNSIAVVVDGGTAADIFAGSKYAAVETASIEVKSGSVGSIYGGGAGGADDEDGAIGISSVESSRITVSGGTVNGEIYGGGTEGDATKSAAINITGGTIKDDIYGGGYGEASVGNASVTIDGTNVTFSGGKISIYGGGNGTGAAPSGSVSKVGTASVSLTNVDQGETMLYVYGGGIYGQQSVTGSTVTIKDSTVWNVYGGLANGTGSVETAEIVMNGSTAQNVYGGSMMASTGAENTSVTLTGGSTVANVYGGGENGGVTGDVAVIVNGASVTGELNLGSASGSAAVSGTATLTVSGGNNTINGVTANGIEGGSTINVQDGSKIAGVSSDGALTITGNGVFTAAIEAESLTAETLTFEVTQAELAKGALVNVTGSGSSLAAIEIKLTDGDLSSFNGAQLLSGNIDSTGLTITLTDETASSVTVEKGDMGALLVNSDWAGITAGALVLYDGAYYEIGTEAFGSVAEAAATEASNKILVIDGTYSGDQFFNGHEVEIGSADTAVSFENYVFGGTQNGNTGDISLKFVNGSAARVYGTALNQAGDYTTGNITLEISEDVALTERIGAAKIEQGNLTTGDVVINFAGSALPIYGGAQVWYKGSSATHDSVTINTSGTLSDVVYAAGQAMHGGQITINNGVTTNVTGGSIGTDGLMGGGFTRSDANQTDTAGSITIHGGTRINISGGEITNVYGGTHTYSEGGQLKSVSTITGGTHISMTGGTVGNVQGGGYTAWGSEASIDSTYVSISGGTVTGDVQGGSYVVGGGKNEDSGNSSTITGDATVVISGNANIQGSVYGGSWVNWATGTAASYIGGTSTVIVEGGTIAGNVAGGGVTYAYSGDGANSTLVSENAATKVQLTGGTIHGNVIGGSLAIDEYDKGTSFVNSVSETSVVIDGATVEGDVLAGSYALGQNAKTEVTGDVAISIVSGTIQGDVYGGSIGGSIGGDSTISISGGDIQGGVYAADVTTEGFQGSSILNFDNEGSFDTAITAINGFDEVNFNGGTVNFTSGMVSFANTVINMTVNGESSTLTAETIDNSATIYVTGTGAYAPNVNLSGEGKIVFGKKDATFDGTYAGTIDGQASDLATVQVLNGSLTLESGATIDLIGNFDKNRGFILGTVDAAEDDGTMTAVVTVKEGATLNARNYFWIGSANGSYETPEEQSERFKLIIDGGKVDATSNAFTLRNTGAMEILNGGSFSAHDGSVRNYISVTGEGSYLEYGGNVYGEAPSGAEGAPTYGTANITVSDGATANFTKLSIGGEGASRENRRGSVTLSNATATAKTILLSQANEDEEIRAELSVENSSLTADAITNYGAVNVTGASTLDAEFMAAGTGLLNLNSVAFGSGTSVNDTASYTNNTIGSEIVMTGTNTLTDGAFVSTGWQKNLKIGYGTGTDSDSVSVSGGSALKVGGAAYVGSSSENKGDGAFQVNVSGAGSLFAGSGYDGSLFLRADGAINVSEQGTASFSYTQLKGAVNVDAATYSAINAVITATGGVTLSSDALFSVEHEITLGGAVSMDYTSTVAFETITAAGGSLTIDMDGFSGGLYKLLDYTGSDSYTLEQYKTLIGEENWDENFFTVVNNDLFAADVDMTTLKVNAEWSGLDIGEQVADGFYFGFNAFDTFQDAYMSGTDAVTIKIGSDLDNVTGELGLDAPYRSDIQISSEDGNNYTLAFGSPSSDGLYAWNAGQTITIDKEISLVNMAQLMAVATDTVVTIDGNVTSMQLWAGFGGTVNINETATVTLTYGDGWLTLRDGGTVNVKGTVENASTFDITSAQAQFDLGYSSIGDARSSDNYAGSTNVFNITNTFVDGGAWLNLGAATWNSGRNSVNMTNSVFKVNALNMYNDGQFNVGNGSRVIVNGALKAAEDSVLNITDDSSVSVKTLSVETAAQVNMDYTSTLAFGSITNDGTITIDTEGFSSGIYKILDYTGTGTYTKDQYKALLGNNWNNYYTFVNNDLYLTNLDGSEVRYVNSAWSSSNPYDEVMFVDGTRAYYGQNAFDTVDHALTATSYENGIWLNVTGDIGSITVVGASVTEVNASAKPADLTANTVIDADAIVVNLVEIDNTNAGWQVYYPLASGSDAKVYGDITTNFLSSTFTEGSQTADPNFAGAGYAGTTATVYGDTMVNIGADGAENDALFLNTGFLLGAGGGIVNGDSSLNIYSGTIEAGAVVGGGAWGGLVKGDSSVTISGGEITLGTSTYNAVYGGSYGYANPTSAETRGSASVTIKGDAVVNGKVIGGSDQTAVTGTTVEISGEAQVNGNVYAGGNRGGQVTGNTSVKVNGGTVSGNVFGGGYASDVTGTTSLVMTGGTVNGALLGGGEEGNVGDTSIEVSGGTIYSGVAGGGASGTAGNTKVHITGDTQITGDGYGVVLGGGQYIGADVESTSVVIEGNVRITDTWAVEDGGTGLNYGYVYGGGWSGSVNGDTNVVVKGNALVASGVLGGGSWSDSDPYEGSVKGNTYVEIAENAVIGDTHEGYVYGGGWGQNVEGSATVVIKDNATIKHSVVGGGIDSTVASTDVRIEGGTVGKNIYAGGYYNDSTLPVENSDVLGDASVTISGGTVSGNVYAGGFYSNVNGNASVTLTGGTVGGDIYGGSESSGTVAGSSTLNVGATDAARYTTTLNNVYDFDVANITNAAVTVEGVFSATQISIADSTLTLNSGFDAATTTVSIEVGAYNAENAALVLGSAVGTAPAISISAGSNALTEARYLVATGFDDTTAFSLDESLAGEYILRAVDGNIYLYNADAPYFTIELSVTQAEGASVDGYYSFTANFEAAGLLTGYTLKLYDSATATTPVDEVTLDADVIGQEFTLENTTQSFWISVTANGENGLSTDSPTSGRLEVVVKDYDSPVIQSVSSNVASDAITLTCEATDNFGVTGYEFILDGQSLGVQTGSEIALDLSTLTAGTHSYTVNVYDAAGNLATSAEQSFNFTPEPGPTEPANFLYSSQVRMDNGETVSVYATYSDAAAALEYRIGDSGEWLTYDATTGVNVSSSTTVYFREQGITDPVETAVDVTVVPADVELNAEVILLAPTTDTTYEVIYNFADGGSKAVELSGNSVEHYALPENTTVTIVEKDASGEVVNTIVEETPAASTTAEIPDKVVAVDDGHDNLFFAMPVGQWGTGIAAQHLGDGTWGGTLEIVSLTGKNRFSTVFTGSDDATTLFLTDDANGDVFFLDDIYTANGSDARIRKMSEIQAGAGDDIVDLTSARFAYEEHASKQLTVRGGDGNDILWGNAGHNIMFGDDGNDRIYGGSDNDVLIGGTGNDTMLGGGGDDIFCYGSSFDWGSDTITQLSGGTVTLYLDGIDRNDCSISGSTLTWNDGTHTGSITLNGVSWDSVKFYCAANGDGDLTKQSDYEELKNKGAFAAISSH